MESDFGIQHWDDQGEDYGPWNRSVPARVSYVADTRDCYAVQRRGNRERVLLLGTVYADVPLPIAERIFEGWESGPKWGRRPLSWFANKIFLVNQLET